MTRLPMPTMRERARSQVQNSDGAMEHLGGAKIVARVADHRKAPKTRALAGDLGVLSQKILKNLREVLAYRFEHF